MVTIWYINDHWNYKMIFFFNFYFSAHISDTFWVVRQVGRAGGLKEDFHQRAEAVRGVGRAGGLREDFHQRAEAVRGVERGEASERTSIKGLRPSGEWRGGRPQRGLPSKG